MTIIREFSWCKLYGIEYVKINVGVYSSGVTIFDSHKIRKIKHMLEVLDWVKGYVDFEGMQATPRWQQVCEWRAHNLLYDLKYQIDRTCSVDLNIDEPWYHKVGYVILSLFYWK